MAILELVLNYKICIITGIRLWASSNHYSLVRSENNARNKMFCKNIKKHCICNGYNCLLGKHLSLLHQEKFCINLVKTSFRCAIKCCKEKNPCSNRVSLIKFKSCFYDIQIFLVDKPVSCDHDNLGFICHKGAGQGR